MTIEKRLEKLSPEELKGFDGKLELLVMLLKLVSTGVVAFRDIREMLTQQKDFSKVLSSLMQMAKDEKEEILSFTGDTPVSLAKDKVIKLTDLFDSLEELVDSLQEFKNQRISENDSNVLALKKEIHSLKKENFKLRANNMGMRVLLNLPADYELKKGKTEIIDAGLTGEESACLLKD